MTPTEILSETQKLPLAQKRQVLLGLTEQLNQVEPIKLAAKEEEFLEGLQRKGLLTEMPLRLPEDEARQNFKPVEIKGEPLSETIIMERG